MQIGKEQIRLSRFSDDTMTYVENPKESKNNPPPQIPSEQTKNKLENKQKHPPRTNTLARSQNTKSTFKNQLYVYILSMTMWKPKLKTQ